MRLTKGQVAGGLAVGLVGIAGAAILDSTGSAAPSGQDCARSIVEKNLKAPSTARWLKLEELERRGQRRNVFVSLDAQNEFGVMLRHGYCVIFEIKGDTYVWHREHALSPCSDPPQPHEVAHAKRLNNWPP